MQMPRDVEQKKKTKEYQCVRARGESRSLHKKFVNGLVRDRLIATSTHSLFVSSLALQSIIASPCLSPSHSFLFTLRRMSSLFVKAASRHALGDWGMRRDCALQFGQCLTDRANRLCN